MTSEAERLEQAESQILELLGKRIAVGTVKSADVIAWTNLSMSQSLRHIEKWLEKLVAAVDNDPDSSVSQVLGGLLNIEGERRGDERLLKHALDQAAFELREAERQAKRK